MAAVSPLIFTRSPEAQLDDLLFRICTELQLDESGYHLATGAYEAAATWLELQPSLAPLNPAIYPQGSMRLNTTVKPLGGDEFDLDFVCEFDCGPRSFQHPIQALDLIEQSLRASGVYRPMVERKNRCIRLNYQQKFHMDILPACRDPKNGGSCVLVPDRRLQEWIASNPKGYAEWFDARARQLQLGRMLDKAEPIPPKEAVDAKSALKLCVQLVKRHRDVRYKGRPAVQPISIVLTTLAGYFYRGETSVVVAMSNILSRTAEHARSSRPRLTVLNPSNRDEDLSERWDANPAAYREFVDFATHFDAQWKALLQLRGVDKVARLLKEQFGEEVITRVIASQARDVEAARTRKEIGMRKGSGIITSAAAAATIPIRSNTFYGEKK